MERTLIVGAESVVGANLCVHWSPRFEVAAVSPRSISLSGCQVLPNPGSRRSPETLLAEVQPDVVVYCGPESRSPWEAAHSGPIEADAESAAAWASAARDAGAAHVHLSSDAVFTGPWMFHDEASECFCPSPSSRAIRLVEDAVSERHPEACIVRTHAFGWSPDSRAGWLEVLLSTIEARRPLGLDAVRHATPMLATDLADVLEAMLAGGLTGTFHVAGAERVSPMGLAQRLASQFNLPWIPSGRDRALTEPPHGFGAGECSLQTKKIRGELCRAMPLLSESLDRLEAQQINGHRERLSPNATVQLRAA
ncbi:MAG: sugar nucleotide-binding protein [Planctomyces sp.]|nr:sugar nucleotide-binding protein [Planctomyces sp.]